MWQVGPLLEKLSSLDAPLSAASPVQEAPLAQYKRALQQVSTPAAMFAACLHSRYRHSWSEAM